MDELQAVVDAEGGVMRVAELRARGFARRAIEGAVATATISRPRNGWVATHDADPVENVLSLVARCLPHEEALAVWESALHQGFVERDSLARMPLPTAARELLRVCSSYSDSGLETFVPVRLRFLRLPVRQQVWIAGHHVDHLIGDRLVLQIDGGHHVGAQRRSDIAHDARLKLLGYHVIRVDYELVVRRWPEVHDLIVRAIAQGLHRAA